MTDTIDRPAADDDHVLDHLIIRFAGDSGDGMQLTGDRFTSVSASFGNDLSTLPDFPAEIRAPAGTVNGVSAFQVNIADHKITTPGDEPNVLVAMNPAALMADLHRLEPGGTVIVNEDAFEERNLEKAGYKVNPLDDDSLAHYRVLRVPMTTLTKEICAPLGVKPRDAERSKNFFALGLVSFMYTRPVDPTLDWIAEKFGGNELVEAANKASFLAGFNFGETTEAVGDRYEVKPAKLPAGEYTSITGNTALAWGIVAAGQLAKLPITLGSYPITPASDILHELSKHKHFGIRTVQAEDEIAAIGMALGAAFAFCAVASLIFLPFPGVFVGRAALDTAAVFRGLLLLTTRLLFQTPKSAQSLTEKILAFLLLFLLLLILYLLESLVNQCPLFRLLDTCLLEPRRQSLQAIR